MHDTDQKLLSLLRENARSPVATLARQLKVSRATVQNRIRRLEQDGVIVGYTVRLKPGDAQHRIRALMTIRIEGSTTDAVIRELRGRPEVQALHTTNGRWDVIAEIHTETLEAFDLALGRIRQIPGIAATETSLLLSTLK